MAKATPKNAPKVIAAPSSPWLNDKRLGYVLAGIAFLLYAQTISFGYALDDMAVIYNNNFVKEGFGGFSKILSTFYWQGCPSFATANAGLFRPVSMLLFATEWQLFPDKPNVYHFVNVALYAVCAYQLYRTLRELLRDYSLMLPLLAVGIWIVLPIHTEVVANIKSADELLSLLFSLLALRQLLKWNDTGSKGPLMVSAAYLFLALLSKEGAALFFPVMMLALLLFRGKKISDLLLPAGLLLAVILLWFGWHWWVTVHESPKMISYDYHNNALLSSPSFFNRLGTATGMQARYWLKMITGYSLSYDYSYNEIPIDGFASPWSWVALTGIGAAAYFAWKKFRSAPVVSFAILFYGITFALTSNIFYLIGDTFAERFTFVPSIGFTLLLAWLILKFTHGLTEKGIHTKAMYVLIPLMLVYSYRTFSRSKAWESDRILMETDVENAPGSGRIQKNYGVHLLNESITATDKTEKRQLQDRAFSQYSLAFTIDTLDYESALALAQIEFARGNFPAAVSWAQRNILIFGSLKMKPNDPMVYSILGNSYIELRKYDNALSIMQEGVQLNPKNETLLIQLGNSYLAQRDTTEAIATYEKAVALNPKSVTAWDKLANVCGMTGRYERSNEAFLQETRLKPDDPHAWQMLYMNASMQHDSVKMKEYEQEFYKHGGK